ncbi:hypothetical protein DH2020_030650 [Rehmannia glutinosa]|uniref:Uncharacterized protein n=1 Tax=Rehmannia glutinosa TaxID=99300 RepID=A0ABR0VK59_REHGL
MALPLEDSREMQYQEGFVGDVSQTPSQRWGEQGMNYCHGSKIAYGSLNSHLPANEIMNEKMGMVVNGRLGGGGSNLMQQKENEILGTELRGRAEDNFLLEQQPKLQGGFVPRSFDSLDDMMNAMIKREHDETLPNCDFGFDGYSFGAGI